MKHNVPIQSLIDHIKTAIDVDPWAKDMVEELFQPVRPKTDSIRRFRCGACDEIIGRGQHYCGKCGREVDWNA